MKEITLNFSKRWFIHEYMKRDWSFVNTIDGALIFYHKWHNDMINSNNKDRIEAIKTIVYPLYSMITGFSYESKINIK